MMLIRLTYFSRSRLDRCNDCLDSGVARILSTSLANNVRDAITGALIYDDHWFAQVLEGAESQVSAAFERILRDQRHCDVSLVTMQPVAHRLYGEFAMACVMRGKDNSDLFRHYGDGEGFDPRLMRTDRLSDLIEAVVERGTRGGPSWMKGSATNAA